MLAFLMVLGPEFASSSRGQEAQAEAKHEAHVVKAAFGKLPDGTEIESYTLYNTRGASAKIITYGATLTELHVPGKNGKLGDVVLGFDNLEGYDSGPHPYFGATIGRYGNRIASGKFTLDGKEYQLAINNAPNSLHGGPTGFDKRVWKAEELKDKDGAAVRFTYLSKDGEENYPGNLKVSVTYTLTNTNELKLQYSAETDKDTVLNLTNHSYFNLSGTGEGNILKYILYINADKYTPVDSTLIPTGKIESVVGTPLDFLKPTAIGARIGELKEVGGYDHNYVLNGKAGTLRLAARVYDPESGREMEVFTTQPGVQFYSAIHLDGTLKGKDGVAYQKYGAICLETQHYPDSPNHPNFPSTELKPAEHFHLETIYKFLVK
ncbi:MAG: aldose epimerase family protein [Candidatus Acidiferrum sp.]